MADQNALDRRALEMNRMAEPEGLLEQFNLPPSLIAFLRRNSRTIWIILACVAVVVVAVSLWDSYRTYTINKAASALDTALQSEGETELLLQAVAEEYSSTPSANLAKIELVKLYQGEENYTEAIALLTQMEADTSLSPLLQPLVTFKLASLYEQQGELTKALGAYTVLSSVEGFEAAAHKAMGRVQESLGNNEQAVAMYTKYLELTEVAAAGGQADPERQIIQSRLQALQL